MKELTQELVRNLFNYKDGELFWKVSRGSTKIGNKAGGLITNGYYRIKINQKHYYTHRLIFLYHYGFLPKMIDHIDRDPSNNKIKNLREINKSQNAMNQKPRKNSVSQYKGVSWRITEQKWQARIQINEKRIHLGYFNDEWCAAFIYNVYARGAFGEFAYLNNLGD